MRWVTAPVDVRRSRRRRVVAAARLELDVFDLQLRVRLAEDVVARARLVEHQLQVLDPLVLALAVGALRGAVLGSAALLPPVVSTASLLGPLVRRTSAR